MNPDRFVRMKQACAEKPHGTRQRYVSGCKCLTCRAANSRYETDRAAARKQGDWNGYVDASKARNHLAWLSANGIGRHSVAAVTDISGTILYGVIKGKRPKIRARSERKILAVDLSVRGDNTHVSSARSWKLLNELLDRGYSKAQLAEWLGYKSRAIQFRRGAPITVRNASRIERLYNLIEAGKMRRSA